MQDGPSRRPELPGVNDPAESIAVKTAQHRRAAAALSFLAAAKLLAACGSGSSTQPQVDVGPNVGEPINLADCSDWNQANTEQRRGTNDQLKYFAGGTGVGNDASSPSGIGAVLDDKKAYEPFVNYCSADFVRGFKL